MSEDFAYKLIVIGDSGVGKSNIATRFCDDLFFPDNVPTLGIDFKYSRCEVLPEDFDVSSHVSDDCGDDGSIKPVVTSSSGSAGSSGSGSRSVRLQVWDTAGHDRFATLTAAFYRSCQGVMMCFDLTNRASFEHLDVWYQRLSEQCTGPKPPPIIVVGCKVDLVMDKEADTHRRSHHHNKTPPRHARHIVDQSPAAGLTSPDPASRPGSTGLILRGETYGFRQVQRSEAEQWARAHNAVCYLETSAKDNINVQFAFQCLATMMVRSLGVQPPQLNNNSGRGRAAIGNASNGGRGQDVDESASSSGRVRRCC